MVGSLFRAQLGSSCLVPSDVGGGCGHLEAAQGWASKLAHLPGWQVMPAVIRSAHLGLLQRGGLRVVGRLTQHRSQEKQAFEGLPSEPTQQSLFLCFVGCSNRKPAQIQGEGTETPPLNGRVSQIFEAMFSNHYTGALGSF